MRLVTNITSTTGYADTMLDLLDTPETAAWYVVILVVASSLGTPESVGLASGKTMGHGGGTAGGGEEDGRGRGTRWYVLPSSPIDYEDLW